MKPLRLLSWNILQGGGRRTPAIISAIQGHDPDVIALTEIRSKSTAPLIRALAHLGWSHTISTNPPGIEYGLCVLSKTPVARVPSQDELPCGGVRWLEVSLPDHGFTLGTVYILPNDSKDKSRKLKYWDALLAAMAKRVGTPYLLMGDFNTGLHRIDEPGKTLHCADKFEQLGESGWTDVWRRSHGDIREYTWYSHLRRGGQCNGFRLDHAFVTPSLAERVKRCWYSHSEREEKSSDHSVLLVEFEPPGTV